jgi:hypothetical protein
MMKNETTVDQLAKENKIAIVVAPSLGKGTAANRSAVLATGLAARHPEVIGPDLTTADGITLPGFTKVPIAVLTAKANANVPEIASKARQLGCTTLVFLSRAQGLQSYHEYTKYIAGLSEQNLDIDAVIMYGSKKQVNRITGNLPLLR